ATPASPNRPSAASCTARPAPAMTTSARSPRSSRRSSAAGLIPVKSTNRDPNYERRPMSRPRSALLPLPGASPPLSLNFDPALAQLRHLPPADLDALVRQWFLQLGLTLVRVRERRAGMTTYQATLGRPPFTTPVQIRIYQRQNKLQVHHIDAFVGYLTR